MLALKWSWSLLLPILEMIHSLIDFNIAYIVARAIQKQANIPVFTLAMKKTNVH